MISNPLSPNIDKQIVLTGLFIFPLRIIRDNLIEDQRIFPWVIFLLTLITVSLDYGLILCGDD